MARVPIKGSERMPLPGAGISGRLELEELARVTIVLRPRSAKKEASLVKKLASLPPRERSHLSRREFERTFGSTRNELQKVRSFARANSLKVVEASSAKRTVILEGTIDRLSQAFGVSLSRYETPRGRYRGRVGPVFVPKELSSLVSAVLGLDDRPQGRTHFRVRPMAAGGVSYAPSQVGALYDFPSLDGTGQAIGIIELGGGYSQSDVDSYFSGLGIPTPSVTAVSVDGASNSPTGDPNGPDAEVLLDIEVAGVIAPKADIFVYFAPNTDAGFVDAVNEALHGQGKPSIVSISWGQAESTWTPQGVQALDQAFQDAVTLGVTVCAAAGDNGSSDGVDDGLAHVDYPASSQFVTGCGGTTLDSSGGVITSQVVWDDLPSGGATGGGVSDLFALPSWQKGSGVPPSANRGAKVGRGVPDVSGDADPQTGYNVLVDGSKIVVGGTSAVAPLWTGLLTLVNQSLGKSAGYLNPFFYAKGNSAAFRDVTSGTNGAYDAGPGWDACTGWGSPDGAKLLSLIASAGASGKSSRSRASR